MGTAVIYSPQRLIRCCYNSLGTTEIYCPQCLIRCYYNTLGTTVIYSPQCPIRCYYNTLCTTVIFFQVKMRGLSRVFHWGPLTAICIIKWISLGKMDRRTDMLAAEIFYTYVVLFIIYSFYFGMVSVLIHLGGWEQWTITKCWYLKVSHS